MGHPRLRLRTKWSRLAVAGLALLAIGCGHRKLLNEQLAAVAKDWSLVVRASQVIPVYPLSEDLQPGDVLLVGMPVEDQVTLYSKKGFLPLDQHLVRLHLTDYAEFYRRQYGITESSVLPEHWRGKDDEGNDGWNLAPHAAFPTYRFSVESGSGLNLAIPVKGIPFALGLMNSGKASGAVTIGDSYTYGLDNLHLLNSVVGWADSNRVLLRNYEPHDEKNHYLRVISRVYLTGQVTVTVNNEESTEGQANIGADRFGATENEGKSSTGEEPVEKAKAFNDLVREQLPAVGVRVASATDRSVTLVEEFERPLVIGYVGFDLPILKGGRLGPPISTLDQLTSLDVQPWPRARSFFRLAALSHMHAALLQVEGEHADRLRTRMNELDALLPASYPFSLYELTGPTTIQKDPMIVKGAPVEGRGFEALIDFLGEAQTTVETIRDYLPDAPKQTERQKQFVLELERELQSAQEALDEIDRRLSREPVMIEAMDFVFLGE